MRSSFRRPSASLIVSMLALTVALGGTAFAGPAADLAAKAKSVITGKQIKNNSVTGKDLKNGSVTGKDVKRNSLTSRHVKSLTGADINAATLGKVPNAGAADTATTAGTAGAAGKLFSQFDSGLVKASDGQEKVLLTNGPFSIVGKCDATNGTDTFIRTTLDGSSMFSYDDSASGEFDSGAANEQRVGYGTGATAAFAFYNGFYSDFSAASPDGSVRLYGFANEARGLFGADCAWQIWGFRQ